MRRITACRKIPTTSHWWVELLGLRNVQRHHSTDYSDPHIQSSLPLCRLDSKFTLIHVWSQQTITWKVMCNPSILIRLGDRLYGRVEENFLPTSGRLLLQSVFPRERKQHEFFQILQDRRIKWVRFLQGTPHAYCYSYASTKRSRIVYPSFSKAVRPWVKYTAILVLRKLQGFVPNICRICHKVFLIHYRGIAVDRHLFL